jgi:phosphatidylserine decarboxylase
VFAPETGRWLLPSLLALLFAAVLLGLGILPVTLVYVGILLIAASYWVFFAAFFRDPERSAGPGIVSPADGRVQEVEREGDRVRVAVFMNVTDVHVNRFPISGRVETIETSGAGFRPAYVPDARHNLQRSYRLSTDIGTVEVVQMTGMVARRLVSFVQPGETHAKGERLGMIALGSRVDLLLPADRVRVSAAVGDRVLAGESTIARERP